MLTKSASLNAPLDSEVHRVKARIRRRDAAAPYLKREKNDEAEKDVEFYGHEPSSTAHSRRGSGFLARLASYIPIVNKLVAEDDEEEVELQRPQDSSVDIQTTQEDVDEDEEAHDEAEKEREAHKHVEEHTRTLEPQQEMQQESIPEGEEVLGPMAPVTRTAPLFVTPKDQLATPPRLYSKRGLCKSRSPSRDSSVESGERSPALMRQARKRGDKRVYLPGPSHQSKMLRIANSQHRRNSTSPSPHDSALTVIKQKKTITLEEFERLQKQLHDMVEVTPQTQLAMTQAALANGLEHPFTRGFPGPTSFPGYVPGSIAHANHGALIVHEERKETSDLVSTNGLPVGKRPRSYENRPLLFSRSTLRGQLTREERLLRKPRPSRLLTGAKRDIAARNAYSAAVAEKILSTLNKVQTPLEREAQKPTPSTSLSWAKYHLSLMDIETKTLDSGMQNRRDDIAPPTSTLPRVAFSQSAHNVSAMETPVKSVAKPFDSSTPLISPQSVSMTPALPAKSRALKQSNLEKTGNFEFTLPLCVPGTAQIDEVEEDTRVQFTFSPPPSLCEPPVKVSTHKSTAKPLDGAVPYNLVSSSPKLKTTKWVSKPLKTKESEMPKAAVDTPVAALKETERVGSKSSAPAASTSAAVNPLARFMQLKPGQWKCPGCSVLNEASSAKCPCCETANPSSDNVPKATALTAPKVSGTTLNSGFTIGGSGTDSMKNTFELSDGAISASGFSFGAPAADSKSDTEKPDGSMLSSGFSFSVSTAGAKKDIDKPISGITSSGFSFTAPTPASDSGGISFGASDTSNPMIKTFTGSTPISFKFSAPAKKADETSADFPPGIEKADTAPSFSFGIPPASTSAVAHVSTDTSAGFTFNISNAGTNKGKRKAFEVEEPKKNVDSSSSFNVTSMRTTEASRPSKSNPIQAISKDLERPKKRLVPSSVVCDSKSEASIPAFSFGSASKPPQVPIKEATGAASSTSTLPFNMMSSYSNAENPKEANPSSVNFGAASSTEKITGEKPVDTALPKSGFTFGSLPSKAAPEPNSGFGQPKSKAPAFSFGAPSASPETVTSVPAASTGFTFGQSSTTSITGSAPAFGAASPTSSPPAFRFGTSTPTPTAASIPPVPLAPAFTFGSSSSSQPAVPSSFGSSGSTAFTQKSATLGFGSTSNAFGSNLSSGFGSGSNTGGFNSLSTSKPTTAFAPTTPAVPAFSFGASSQTPSSSAPAAGQPAFSFGASSAPSGFGAAPVASSGFGSSASDGFNATPGGFRSSSPAPVFGNQAPSTASAFGNSLPPPTVTFGGSSFGAPAASGFNSGPPSSGFRTPSPTSAFSKPSAFGAAPTFGAPAAGAFGAASVPAFGAAPASVPAFGTAPASVPAFGAAPAVPAFGAASAPAAGAFGAPSSTAGAFGVASADGGFNMGAAPQHAKGRRILKAKTRSRRTS